MNINKYLPKIGRQLKIGLIALSAIAIGVSVYSYVQQRNANYTDITYKVSADKAKLNHRNDKLLIILHREGCKHCKNVESHISQGVIDREYADKTVTVDLTKLDVLEEFPELSKPINDVKIGGKIPSPVVMTVEYNSKSKQWDSDSVVIGDDKEEITKLLNSLSKKKGENV